jgi:hypothetical protein
LRQLAPREKDAHSTAGHVIGGHDEPATQQPQLHRASVPAQAVRYGGDEAAALRVAALIMLMQR